MHSSPKGFRYRRDVADRRANDAQHQDKRKADVNVLWIGFSAAGVGLFVLAVLAIIIVLRRPTERVVAFAAKDSAEKLQVKARDPVRSQGRAENGGRRAADVDSGSSSLSFSAGDGSRLFPPTSAFAQTALLAAPPMVMEPFQQASGQPPRSSAPQVMEPFVQASVPASRMISGMTVQEKKPALEKLMQENLVAFNFNVQEPMPDDAEPAKSPRMLNAASSWKNTGVCHVRYPGAAMLQYAILWSQRVDGEITPASDPDPLRKDSRCVSYVLVFDPARWYVIEMRRKPGSAVDPYLRAHHRLTRDLGMDGGGGSVHARMLFGGSRKGYEILFVATTAGPNQFGAFDLVVSEITTPIFPMIDFNLMAMQLSAGMTQGGMPCGPVRLRMPLLATGMMFPPNFKGGPLPGSMFAAGPHLISMPKGSPGPVNSSSPTTLRKGKLASGSQPAARTSVAAPARTPAESGKASAPVLVSPAATPKNKAP